MPGQPCDLGRTRPAVQPSLLSGSEVSRKWGPLPHSAAGPWWTRRWRGESRLGGGGLQRGACWFPNFSSPGGSRSVEGGPRGLSIHCQAGWPPVEPHGRSRFLRPLAPSPAAAAQGSCPPRSCPLSVPPPRPPGTPFLSTDPLLPSPRPSSGLAVPPPTRCPLAFPTQSLSAGVGSPPTPGCGPEVAQRVQ